MICNNCKKTIEDDSKFCQFCGSKIEPNHGAEGNTLWQVFVELSFETDKERRQKNRQMIPSSIREIIKRLSTNLFDSLKEENELILDLPYAILEDIRNSYYFLAEDGFWVYLAKRRVSGHKSHELIDKDVEKLIKEWDKTFVKDKEEGKKMVGEEILETIIASRDIQVNHLLENHEEIKKLPAKVIEKMKGDLILMPYWVYGCCVLSERREK
ncbi:MAG: hypothetical protein BWY34_00075 [Parcubacteria group bacterium ADurb.Bin247]|nr:MAG: hypothetical protein BWY34_00075 [Parcubacteria group bacterium ADurb.Bin247]